MTRLTLAALLLACTTVLPGLAHAEQTDDTTEQAGQDRLLIVNGASGRVIYDDGRNDLFCVTRRVIVRYDWDGQPVTKRTMRCR